MADDDDDEDNDEDGDGMHLKFFVKNVARNIFDLHFHFDSVNGRTVVRRKEKW